jgi:hemoglobin/transferrin/lactoferrin receptor protein
MLFQTILSFGQKTIIVRDATDKTVLVGAVVRSLENEIQVIATDANGEADISELSGKIEIRMVGFESVYIHADEISDKTAIFLEESSIALETVVLSASRFEEELRTTPHLVQSIGAKQIAFNSPVTSGDLLQQTGQVFVQTSQLGGGSPIIRGFEANRVLMVVDGVRMNNAIYRGGHLQNIITLDPNVLERVEVLYGNASSIYGSDALGGVMHFITAQPIFSQTGLRTNIRPSLQYQSAANAFTGSVLAKIGGNKWASVTGITYKNIGDLRTGTRAVDKDYPDFGKRPFYVERINGMDSIVSNSKPEKQVQSGYTQYDILQKIAFRPNEATMYTLNIQYSNSSDIPRYDRLTETSSGKPSYAAWYYGPQERFLASFQIKSHRKTAFYDQMNTIFAYQNILESRHQRRFNRTGRTDRTETVDIGTLNLDFQKNIAACDLKYGIETTFNHVKSVAETVNILTGAVSPATTRYPDGGSELYSAALYVSNSWKISPKWYFSQSLRLSYVGLKAKFEDKYALMKFPFKEASQTNIAPTGHLGIVFLPAEKIKIAYLSSTGFRSPNIDDLGKVFDSAQGNVVVPNPKLRPEYAITNELSSQVELLENKLSVEAAGFYTNLRQAISMQPFNYNVQDSILYDGVQSRVLANQNVVQANITGASITMKAMLSSWLNIETAITKTWGKLTNNGGYLDHIPPLYGKTTVRLGFKNTKIELYVLYNAKKPIEKYSLSGEDNQLYATPEGMPAWCTFNIKGSYQFNKYLQLQIGMENITDIRYRLFASGISAPGRNILVTLRGNY